MKSKYSLFIHMQLMAIAMRVTLHGALRTARASSITCTRVKSRRGSGRMTMPRRQLYRMSPISDAMMQLHPILYHQFNSSIRTRLCASFSIATGPSLKSPGAASMIRSALSSSITSDNLHPLRSAWPRPHAWICIPMRALCVPAVAKSCEK